MGAFRQAVRGVLDTLTPPSRFLQRGPANRLDVALTFDDGPHPEHTPRLLDRLAELKMSASFFVIGREAERFPELVLRAAREGHAIGHHSWSHSEPKVTSARVLADEVDRTCALLEGMLRRKPDRFRPPKGQLTLAKTLGLWRRGQRIVLWSADPKDFRLTDADRLSQWADRWTPRGGEIVLMHDNHPHAAATLDHFAAWREQGVRFVTLDAWLPSETPT